MLLQLAAAGIALQPAGAFIPGGEDPAFGHVTVDLKGVQSAFNRGQTTITYAITYGLSFCLICDATGNTIKPMNTATKLLEAMRNNPRDWRIEQLQTVARQFGIAVRCEGGSHHVFSHEVMTDIVCVPAHRPIKPVYVRQFVALVDKAKESQA